MEQYFTDLKSDQLEHFSQVQTRCSSEMISHIEFEVMIETFVGMQLMCVYRFKWNHLTLPEAVWL